LRERDIIRDLLAPLSGAGARGLSDDCAVIAPPPGRELVLTKDMMASGVHFLSADPPETVAHKLLAVNLSDLAAKGAVPLACLLGLAITEGLDDAWLRGFAQGLRTATNQFACPLLGGDTISGVDRITLSLTAFGHVAPGAAPDRAGARPGDLVYVSGTVGDAGLGLRQLLMANDVGGPLVGRYRKPAPQLALGQGLAALATASCDVSDGLLRDALNICEASDINMALEGPALPLGQAFLAAAPDILMGSLAHWQRFAATAGDDYELLFTIAPGAEAVLLTLSQQLGVTVSHIGRCLAHTDGPRLQVRWSDGSDQLPEVLGYQH
jgi:thiamine-monophosphate kinase